MFLFRPCSDSFVLPLAKTSLSFMSQPRVTLPLNSYNKILPRCFVCDCWCLCGWSLNLFLKIELFKPFKLQSLTLLNQTMPHKYVQNGKSEALSSLFNPTCICLPFSLCVRNRCVYKQKLLFSQKWDYKMYVLAFFLFLFNKLRLNFFKVWYSGFSRETDLEGVCVCVCVWRKWTRGLF